MRAALAEAARLAHGASRRRARLVYWAALRQAELAKDQNSQSVALAGLGDLLNPRLYHGRALSLYRRSASLATGTQVDLATARIHFALGVELAGRLSVLEANRHYQDALTLFRRRGDLPMLVRVEDAIGNLAVREGNLARAEQAYSTSLQVSHQTGDLAAVARTLGNISVIDGLRGDRARQRARIESAVEAARAARDRDRLAYALNGLGAFYLNAADYRRALDCFQQAVATHPDDEAELGYSLNDIGIVFAEQGEDALAIEYFERSLQLAEEVGDSYAVVRLVNNLGALYQGQRQYARALQYHVRALRLAQESGDVEAVPGHWYNIGSTRELAGQPALARAAYLESLATAGRVGDRMHAAAASVGLGRLALAHGDPRAARQLATQAITIATAAHSLEISWQARTLAGKALRDLGQPGAARHALLEAIHEVEHIRAQVPESIAGERRLFFAGRLAPYHELIDLLIADHEPAAALVWAERLKARALLDRCTVRDGTGGAAAATLAAQPTGQGDGSLTALTGRLLGPAESPAEMLRTLHPGRNPVLLEFVVTPLRTYLITLTARPGTARPRPRVHSVALGEDELSQAVEGFRQRLATRNLDFETQARHLYDLLLAPAEGEIAPRSDLLVVPDGVLWNLPFEALLNGAREPLLARHAMLYAPSLTLLHLIGTPAAAVASGSEPLHRSTAGTLFALGNPALSGATMARAAASGTSGLPPLPDAEQEVREVAHLYGDGCSKVYTGAAATRRAVLSEAAGFSVLHFATHALLDDRDPMRSSLLLAAGSQMGGEDGALTARDLARLRLGAGLVVLSGCQTAGTSVGKGEGLLGFAWALFAAGTQGVVASQWPVDSAATRELMVQLHNGLRSGLSAAEALRRAALSVAQESRYRHPFYWAGFILLGQGRRPTPSLPVHWRRTGEASSCPAAEDSHGH